MNKASFVLIKNEENKILLVKSLTNLKFIDCWSLPGGVVEAGESLKEGARSEVFEEVGIICDIKYQLRQIKNKDQDITATTFIADYVSGGITFQVEEISDAKWFSLEETKDLSIGYDIRDLFTYLQ